MINFIKKRINKIKYQKDYDLAISWRVCMFMSVLFLMTFLDKVVPDSSYLIIVIKHVVFYFIFGLTFGLLIEALIIHQFMLKHDPYFRKNKKEENYE